jgi:CCR4-NOT transcription complex subunit 6
MTYLLDNAPIADQPAEREWCRPGLADTGRVRSDGTQPEMTVLCYNVLSDKYATRQLYAYCPSWALDWDYRKQQILKEIAHRDADIILLQEVETREFYGYFQPELHQRGYEGVFQAKSRARNMGDHDSKSVDGCAIFFKCSKFEMTFNYLIEFERLSTQLGAGTADMINRVMPKDNIACGVVLETKPEGRQVFVSNAHLTWDPEFKDVKVIQAVMLLHEVNKVVEAHKKKDGPKPAVIIGGDFNSTPDSGVYEFMTRSKIAQSHPDLAGRDYKGFAEKVGLKHNFNLRSCYQSEMPYTNYTHDFTGIIDYIFYSADTIVPAGILGPSDIETMESFDGCPNPHFPSDHLSIAAQLTLA